MIKNNLGWIVASIILVCQPALSAAPTLCLWDMYAMAAIAGRGTACINHWTMNDQEVVDSATSIANEMIKRRSGK